MTLGSGKSVLALVRAFRFRHVSLIYMYLVLRRVVVHHRLPLLSRRAKVTTQCEARCKCSRAPTRRRGSVSSMFRNHDPTMLRNGQFNHRQPLGNSVFQASIKSSSKARESGTYTMSGSLEWATRERERERWSPGEYQCLSQRLSPRPSLHMVDDVTVIHGKRRSR